MIRLQPSHLRSALPLPMAMLLPTNSQNKKTLEFAKIHGVPAHGIRQTQTVTDENDGKEVVITDEYWYSQDLRINLTIKHSDPRKGMTTMTVAQVTRT